MPEYTPLLSSEVRVATLDQAQKTIQSTIDSLLGDNPALVEPEDK